MAELTQRFPESIARGATGGPGYSTTVVAAFGGGERRAINWEEARHRYDVSQAVKDDEAARELDAFFRKARGRAHTFRFKDWMDYRLAAAESRLVLVSGTTYQISKVYGDDEPTFEEVRSLRRIVAGTLVVYSAGAPLTLGVDYTADLATGRITTASGTLTAACEFDVPCRLDFDDKDATLVTVRPNGDVLVGWSGIRIVEVLDE
jgi:uncharacterized protein (TIGR02217 family)